MSDEKPVLVMPRVTSSGFFDGSKIQKNSAELNSILSMKQTLFHDENDRIVRTITTDSGATWTTNSFPTSALSNAIKSLLNTHENDLKLMNTVIDWQAQTIEYNALQQALNFGAISEAEFDEELEKFIRDESSIPKITIIEHIKRLKQILRKDLSIDDYANLFCMDPEDLKKDQILENSEPRLLEKD